MIAYVARRLTATTFVLLGVSIAVFLTLHLTPGDPALVMLGPIATQEDITRLRQDLGLNDPLYVQYGLWMGKVLRGDLGRSITMRRPVLPEVMLRFRATLILTAAAAALSTVLGMLAGVIAGTRQNSAFDRTSMVLALVGVSMPVFWLGIVLIYLFSVRLQWLPAASMYSPTGGGPADLLLHLILPSVTLAAASMGIVARLTRSSMLEVIRQDYIRTARAKGNPERRVVSRHGVKNALIPVVTVLGVQIGYLLGGAVLTETVFNWPGVGTMMVRAILARDFPVVQGGVLFVAAVFVLVNLAVDVLYVYLDPRIRYA